MEIIFASGNINKRKEIAKILNESIEIVGLDQLGVTEEIPETRDTLEGNALQKAEWIFDRFKKPVFADDTGLEVEALDGRPGVYSARYAGEQKSADDNMDKILSEMEGVTNRAASFITIIAFIDSEGQQHFFQGEVKGEILESKSGAEGFGYDPIFKPEGYDISFAEMTIEEKNKVSHRARATKAFADFLNGL